MTARRSIEAQGPARVENRRFKARGRNYVGNCVHGADRGAGGVGGRLDTRAARGAGT
jgi:hypothetical protein